MRKRKTKENSKKKNKGEKVEKGGKKEKRRGGRGKRSKIWGKGGERKTKSVFPDIEKIPRG